MCHRRGDLARETGTTPALTLGIADQRDAKVARSVGEVSATQNWHFITVTHPIQPHEHAHKGTVNLHTDREALPMSISL